MINYRIENERETTEAIKGEAFNIIRKEGSLRSIFNEIGVTENLIGSDIIKPSFDNLSVLKSNQFENEILLFIVTSKVLETSQYQPIKKEIKLILEHIRDKIN